MTDTFCSDIVALFINHLWECPECLDKVGDYIFSTFVLVGALSFILLVVFTYIFSLIQRIVYRCSYKKKYDDIKAELYELKNK